MSDFPHLLTLKFSPSSLSFLSILSHPLSAIHYLSLALKPQALYFLCLTKKDVTRGFPPLGPSTPPPSPRSFIRLSTTVLHSHWIAARNAQMMKSSLSTTTNQASYLYLGKTTPPSCRLAQAESIGTTYAANALLNQQHVFSCASVYSGFRDFLARLMQIGGFGGRKRKKAVQNHLRRWCASCMRHRSTVDLIGQSQSTFPLLPLARNYPLFYLIYLRWLL